MNIRTRREAIVAITLMLILTAFMLTVTASAASSPTVPVGRSGTVYFSQRQRHKSPTGNTVSLESGWYAFAKTESGPVYDIYRCTYPTNHYGARVRVYPGDPIQIAALGNRR